jgi:hypothetical protein
MTLRIAINAGISTECAQFRSGLRPLTGSIKRHLTLHIGIHLSETGTSCSSVDSEIPESADGNFPSLHYAPTKPYYPSWIPKAMQIEVQNRNVFLLI